MIQIGRFKSSDKLTKLIQSNHPDWVIYRDPSVGLYVYNVKTGDEINLEYYSSKTIGDPEEFAREVGELIEIFERKQK